MWNITIQTGRSLPRIANEEFI